MSSPMSTENTIDRILVYCARHDIARAEKPNTIQIGRFQFVVNPHDTGNSIYGWILDGDERYQFLNMTWWFSSSYTFNEGLWEHGAWDHELEEAFDRLRGLVQDHRVKVAQAQEHAQQEQSRRQEERKARFEQLFK